jgi:phage shock protein A
MGIFSRTRDIFAANMTELLDRAEDPARMIRMIILEMEETLVEVRASAARSIADSKEMKRALIRLEDLQGSWTEKAELALSKDREDLAKAALLERQKAADMAASLKSELDAIEDTLKGYEADIAKLQGKLREARSRQNAIATRIESAVTPRPHPRDAERRPHRRCFLALRAAGTSRGLRGRTRRRARHDRAEDPGRGNRGFESDRPGRRGA